jgi:hypothetical protein
VDNVVMASGFKELPYGPKYHSRMHLCEGVECVETIFSVTQCNLEGGEGTALGTLSWDKHSFERETMEMLS